MSTDFSIKPVGAPAAIPVAQPVSEATNNAVQTVLPASQSVTVPDARSTNCRSPLAVLVTYAVSPSWLMTTPIASVASPVIVRVRVSVAVTMTRCSRW